MQTINVLLFARIAWTMKTVSSRTLSYTTALLQMPSCSLLLSSYSGYHFYLVPSGLPQAIFYALI